MRIVEQKVTNGQQTIFELEEFLSRPLFAHLATNSELGPRESPVWFHWDGDHIWIIGGDSFPDNVRRDARCAVGIVDFDRAGFGDPAIDLGAFAADLEYHTICSGLDLDRAQESLLAFRRGYATGSDSAAGAQLPTFEALSLLKLAAQPFRHRRPDWPELLQRIVERADAMLTAPRRAAV